MASIDRRNFLRGAIVGTAAVALGLTSSEIHADEKNQKERLAVIVSEHDARTYIDSIEDYVSSRTTDERKVDVLKFGEEGITSLEDRLGEFSHAVYIGNATQLGPQKIEEFTMLSLKNGLIAGVIPITKPDDIKNYLSVNGELVLDNIFTDENNATELVDANWDLIFLRKAACSEQANVLQLGYDANLKYGTNGAVFITQKDTPISIDDKDAFLPRGVPQFWDAEYTRNICTNTGKNSGKVLIDLSLKTPKVVFAPRTGYAGRIAGDDSSEIVPLTYSLMQHFGVVQFCAPHGAKDAIHFGNLMMYYFNNNRFSLSESFLLADIALKYISENPGIYLKRFEEELRESKLESVLRAEATPTHFFIGDPCIVAKIADFDILTGLENEQDYDYSVIDKKLKKGRMRLEIEITLNKDSGEFNYPIIIPYGFRLNNLKDLTLPRELEALKIQQKDIAVIIDLFESNYIAGKKFSITIEGKSFSDD